jgi:L-threonylcarbamoyladenylate synthase
VKVFHAERLSDEAFDQILSLLHRGGVIAFPTDTAYGLGADPYNDAALDRIFTIKGRPESKPILLIVNSIEMAKGHVQQSQIFDEVARAFWPGPLTVITGAAPFVSEKLTAGSNTVGLRWPVASFATSLVDRLSRPITATSANRSGMPSAITVGEVQAQLGDLVDAIIDGGSLAVRGGSTILDLTSEPPAVLREGPVTFETLSSFFNGRIRRHVA